jgi:hypothetical protein
VYLHVFLTSEVDESEMSASRSGRSTPRETVLVITEHEAGSAPELVESSEEEDNFRPLSGMELRFPSRPPCSLFTVHAVNLSVLAKFWSLNHLKHKYNSMYFPL